MINMTAKGDAVSDFLSRRAFNPKQMDFFEERAAIWDKITVHDHQKVERITSLLGMKGDEMILDVGTGTGIMIPFYEKHLTTGRVCAIDYSEAMIEQARKKYPEPDHPLVFYRVLDLYRADFGPVFDLVVCYSCFPHFPDPLKAICVLGGCLKEGGRLVIAHSSSKEHINKVHMDGGEEINTDFLPEMKVMKAMMEMTGMGMEFEQDDSEYYIAIAKKG